MNKDRFLEELEKLNITLTELQRNQLDEFYHLLITYNEKMNLTGITKEEDVYLKHFYDSLTLVKAINLQENLTLLDVGTGAGFPGIVLKIVFPHLKITLLDSLNKRINYLSEVIKKLDLTDIETVCCRCEEFSKINREKYDIAVARAVSHLEILSEIIIPSVKVNGYFVAMKASLHDEVKKSEKILNQLDSQIEEIVEFTLPIEESQRSLVKIKKLKVTDVKYPRNFDRIKKSHCQK